MTKTEVKPNEGAPEQAPVQTPAAPAELTSPKLIKLKQKEEQRWQEYVAVLGRLSEDLNSQSRMLNLRNTLASAKTCSERMRLEAKFRKKQAALGIEPEAEPEWIEEFLVDEDPKLQEKKAATMLRLRFAREYTSKKSSPYRHLFKMTDDELWKLRVQDRNYRVKVIGSNRRMIPAMDKIMQLIGFQDAVASVVAQAALEAFYEDPKGKKYKRMTKMFGRAYLGDSDEVWVSLLKSTL